MRGKHVTKPIDEVLAEARELAADGVRELIVVAQDTTYYGIDLYGEPRLAELIGRLDEIEGIEWIRLMYFYPMHVTPELTAQIANSRHVLPYLDMPLQHINDGVLKRMARRVNRAQTEELLARLRAEIPGLALRTTMITGFPGETEEQFEELLAFVEEQRFERLGAFTYSLEPDTPAASLPGHLSQEVMQHRRDRLMDLQRRIALERNDGLIGTQMDVILDRPVPDENNVWIGRSPADAPDVDAVVYVTGGEHKLAAGAIAPCEIVASREYDLVGVAVGSAR
jgi:ribosomal protein S12 methylthiotransferase